MKTDEHYQLLGVSRFVSGDALRHAFRSRLLLVHPDRNSGDALATEQTRKIIEAYKVLSDPTSRRKYDLSLAAFMPTRVASFTPSSPSIPQSVSKSAIFLCFIVLVVCAAIFIGGAVAGNQGPVFRAVLIAQPLQTELRDFPIMPEPNVADALEWYHARVYQLSLGNKWAKCELVKVYSDAARRAARIGDSHRARFYLDSLDLAESACSSPVFAPAL